MLLLCVKKLFLIDFNFGVGMRKLIIGHQILLLKENVIDR